MNIKELKMNLLLLGFSPIPKYKHQWTNLDLKKYTVHFGFIMVTVGKLKVDNHETLQPILDKVIRRIANENK